MKIEYVSIKEYVLKKLEANLPEIRERFGIDTIGIFGSVSRGEDTADSDVDVMISFRAGSMTMRNFMGLADFLEELFDRKVDLVTTTGISPYILPYVQTEIIWMAKV
ncbi:MAG: nucleotidyltransferase family protein [Methanocorpusculum sp.]|nr:nucleotidyltransferase family protein [Methanocorpusculum sp.]